MPESDHPQASGPEQERVRRLLADARHSEPVPADVAARLERVLAGLAAEERAEPATGTTGAPVAEPEAPVQLDAARRRRRAGALLLAAAAVVVAGVGIGQLGGSGAGNDSAGSAADGESLTTLQEEPAGGSAAQSAPAEEDSAADGSVQPESAQPESQSQPGPPGPLAYALAEPQSLASDTFARDARRVVRRLGAGGSVAEGADGVPASPGFTCSTADYGPGALVPVLYDGVPAVLAVRRPLGTSRVAELLQCGTGALVRSVTLPDAQR